MNKKVIQLVLILIIFVGVIIVVPNMTYAVNQEQSHDDIKEESAIELNTNFESIRASKQNTLEKSNLSDEQILILTNEINSLRQRLLINNVDISATLKNKIEYFENSLLNAKTNEEHQKTQILINNTKYILYEYEFYEETQFLNRDLPTQSLTPIDEVPFNLIYTPVLTYFLLNGYNLAYELLAQMVVNTDFESIYNPYYGYLVDSSQIFQQIVQNGSSYSSSVFDDDGTTLGGDLHNAVNKFEYRRSDSGRVVVLTDYYDFEFGWEGYTTVAGVAVNALVLLQSSGVLTPFYTVIEREVSKPLVQPAIKTISKISSTNRYLDRVVTLGRGEYQEFNISFSVAGYKNFQTMGSKDAYLELYDSSGTRIAYNDDSGYKLNALLNYNFSANTNYKIRVRFFSSSRSGDIKLVITPSQSTNYDLIQQIVFEGWWIFGSYKVTVNTIANYVNLYRFIPYYGGLYYDIHTTDNGSSDPYIYVIDPRLPILLNPINPYSPNQYNDDGTNIGLNSRIFKRLATDVPYMIIGALYNIMNQGSYVLRTDHFQI